MYPLIQPVVNLLLMAFGVIMVMGGIVAAVLVFGESLGSVTDL